ncbi:3'-5' exonuclease [Undibacterium sp. Ji50W]|uniref:3'-5' exonuclease n=1 Tax=Undibacterium sp. Ji50W TaxID=3413041 RepID=UPI003BF289EC
MKSLSSVNPSPEQLLIIKRVRAGVEIIRGAAGSGKTTTALLKLKLLILWVQSRRRREESNEPVRALVLTFNKTLRGYVHDLVKNSIPTGNIEITVDTFSHWAYGTLGKPKVCEDADLERVCASASTQIGLPPDFLANEARYVMGRFLPAEINEYLNCRRDGRGAIPRVEKPTRQLILDLIIKPFQEWKSRKNIMDWNDVAVSMMVKKYHSYDIIIVDEAQDFSANQLRSIMIQANDESAKCFILDTAQRIYAGGFTWSEIGLTIRPEDSYRLKVNYRNTPEIARLAASLINCVTLDNDGTSQELLDLTGNPKPILLEGLFNQQVSWCIEYIKKNVDLSTESVAFLNPKGWFSYLESRLKDAGLKYVELTRQSDWPTSNTNIALSTLHSAKGLDFDHCIIIGLSKENLPDGEFTTGDDRFETACRLLSMAIARARIQVVLGYKSGEEPAILNSLDASACEKVQL